MSQKLKRNNIENKSITFKKDVIIKGDGFIGNDNKISKNFFNKKSLGFFKIIGFIAAVITIYLFFFQ